MAVSIAQARLAKPKARAAVEVCVGVVGVGLTKIGDSYAIKVNLRHPLAQADLPQTIDGVRVIYEVVGPVSLRPGGIPS